MLITVNLGSYKDIKEAGKTEMEKISDELLMLCTSAAMLQPMRCFPKNH